MAAHHPQWAAQVTTHSEHSGVALHPLHATSDCVVPLCARWENFPRLQRRRREDDGAAPLQSNGQRLYLLDPHLSECARLAKWRTLQAWEMARDGALTHPHAESPREGAAELGRCAGPR